MAIERIKNRDEIEAFLKPNKVANAYLLGGLDPVYLPFCTWYAARKSGEIQFIALEYTGLSLPAVFFTGAIHTDMSTFQELKKLLPTRFMFHAHESLYPMIQQTFEPKESQIMLRMGLEKENYQSRELDTSDVQTLGHRDTAAMMELYTHYPDHLFEAYQLESGLYFGVPDEELGFSSIAGVHVFSETYGVAAIGNFVTHPSRRGLGLASRCTQKLLDTLFERTSLVTLNVQEKNEAAVKMFRNFGFQTNHVFFEGRVS